MAERRETNFGIPIISDLTAESADQGQIKLDIMAYSRPRGSRRWSRRSFRRSRRSIFSSSDSLKI